jgi:hypothetical protein
MSEHSSGIHAVHETVADDAFHFQQADYWLGKVANYQGSLPIPHHETVEFISVSGADPEVVVRHRHDSRVEKNKREDTYFALHSRPEPRLTLLVDDLEMEQQWIEGGAFEHIKPRRDALARRVAEGDTIYPDVTLGGHEHLRELLRVLHACASSERTMREAEAATLVS